MLAGFWILDRIFGPYPETEADRIRVRNGRAARSPPAILMAPDTMALDVDDPESAALIELRISLPAFTFRSIEMGTQCKKRLFN